MGGAAGMPLRNRASRALGSQRGIALVLVVLALTALLLMAGLALDVSHALLGKTRLQNTVDAAALAAAKTLDQTGSSLLATAEALSAFGSNASAAGNQELAAGYAQGAGSIRVTVQYSSTLGPFTPGAAAGPYVRVIATGFNLPTWLAQLGGITQTTVGASAVAGPSATVVTACNVVPLVACGDPGAGAANLWGYTQNAPAVLKYAASGSSQVGPGNYQLLRLGGSGANVVRQNLAGDYSSCATVGDSLSTQPGNAAGPTADGLNTRFGQYSGPLSQSQYPPDVVVKGQSPALTADSSGNVWQGSTRITAANIALLYDYQNYSGDLGNSASYDYQPVSAGGPGVFQRRVLTVPIGDCAAGSGGTNSIPLLGFGCFFMLQPVNQNGSSNDVIGQFVAGCDTNGTPGPSPSGVGPHLIELYRDPDSGDS
ncbi:MAG TPA: pilus assembly protein TadG-related protein [Steroidobacteraceae bacterium]|nr:pilus assembly protein TadG-related protein [Steroidobacteraceae bacterium]